MYGCLLITAETDVLVLKHQAISIHSADQISTACIRPPGGALGQVSYGGVQLRGSNPYPIVGKAGLRKHTLF